MLTQDTSKCLLSVDFNLQFFSIHQSFCFLKAHSTKKTYPFLNRRRGKKFTLLESQARHRLENGLSASLGQYSIKALID